MISTGSGGDVDAGSSGGLLVPLPEGAVGAPVASQQASEPIVLKRGGASTLPSDGARAVVHSFFKEVEKLEPHLDAQIAHIDSEAREFVAQCGAAAPGSGGSAIVLPADAAAEAHQSALLLKELDEVAASVGPSVWFDRGGDGASTGDVAAVTPAVSHAQLPRAIREEVEAQMSAFGEDYPECDVPLGLLRECIVEDALAGLRSRAVGKPYVGNAVVSWHETSNVGQHWVLYACGANCSSVRAVCVGNPRAGSGFGDGVVIGISPLLQVSVGVPIEELSCPRRSGDDGRCVVAARSESQVSLLELTSGADGEDARLVLSSRLQLDCRIAGMCWLSASREELVVVQDDGDVLEWSFPGKSISDGAHPAVRVGTLDPKGLTAATLLTRTRRYRELCWLSGSEIRKIQVERRLGNDRSLVVSEALYSLTSDAEDSRRESFSAICDVPASGGCMLAATNTRLMLFDSRRGWDAPVLSATLHPVPAAPVRCIYVAQVNLGGVGLQSLRATYAVVAAAPSSRQTWLWQFGFMGGPPAQVSVPPTTSEMLPPTRSSTHETTHAHEFHAESEPPAPPSSTGSLPEAAVSLGLPVALLHSTPQGSLSQYPLVGGSVVVTARDVRRGGATIFVASRAGELLVQHLGLSGQFKTSWPVETRALELSKPSCDSHVVASCEVAVAAIRGRLKRKFEPGCGRLSASTHEPSRGSNGSGVSTARVYLRSIDSSKRWQRSAARVFVSRIGPSADSATCAMRGAGPSGSEDGRLRRGLVEQLVLLASQPITLHSLTQLARDKLGIVDLAECQVAHLMKDAAGITQYRIPVAAEFASRCGKAGDVTDETSYFPFEGESVALELRPDGLPGAIPVPVPYRRRLVDRVQRSWAGRSSRFLGVRFRPSTGLWEAERIIPNKKTPISLGSCASELAAAARVAKDVRSDAPKRSAPARGSVEHATADKQPSSNGDVWVARVWDNSCDEMRLVGQYPTEAGARAACDAACAVPSYALASHIANTGNRRAQDGEAGPVPRCKCCLSSAVVPCDSARCIVPFVLAYVAHSAEATRDPPLSMSRRIRIGASVLGGKAKKARKDTRSGFIGQLKEDVVQPAERVSSGVVSQIEANWAMPEAAYNAEWSV